MIKIALRYKVALELYASISLLAAIIVVIYLGIFNLIGDNIYVPVGIIGFFVLVFMLIIRTLILDVNSAEFETDEIKEDIFIVEIKRINKITLEIIAGISNIILISIIYIYSISKSSGTFKILPLVFIIILCIPILILLKTLVFEFGTIFLSKKNRENFVTDILNRRSIFFIFICIIIIVSVLSSNILVTSVGKLYQKSMLPGEMAIEEVSSNVHILSITGDRKNISGAPITVLNIHIEAEKFDLNISRIIVRYMDDTRTSILQFGIEADESHFSYEGKTTGKDSTKLLSGEVGIITLNLSSTKQELYSYKKGSIILIADRKTMTWDIRAPELKDSSIVLYQS